MDYEEVERELILHLLQCGGLMPISWVRQNGDGSKFNEAYGIALNLVREKAKEENEKRKSE